MKQEEALAIVKSACASVQADLKTHNTIQQALAVVENILSPPAVKTARPDDSMAKPIAKR